MGFHNAAKFLLFSNFLTFLNAANLQVDLPIGSLIGSERKTATDLTYYAYQGIPFAEPPVGSLRFKAPIEKKPWKNVLNATTEGSMCYQMYNEVEGENEDCLFINVYTPVKPSSNKSLAVMFWIYGGGFLNGYASDMTFGADHLLARDTVVVTSNYRVGSFGFFSTGDEIIPGNFGLKDQLLALQWTNKYIKYFGGDPKKITMFGQSAGSASVSYHLLSPKSKGLFRAAICESGSALSTWAYNRNQTKFSYDMTKVINPDIPSNSTSKEILEYLQSVPADEIDKASTKIWYPQYIQIQHGFYFAPVIEVEHEGAFLTKKQYGLIKSGSINNVPVMMGFNSEESISMLTDPYIDQFLDDLEANKLSLIPLDLNEKKELRQEIAGVIYDKYARNQTFKENPRNMIRYMSDQCFVRSIKKHAQLQSKYGKVWFYRFAYEGVMATGTQQSVKGFSPDVNHGEELSYIFAFRYNGHNTTDVSQYPASDIAVHNRMVTLWTNFAKYLNPTPENDKVLQNITWPQFTEHSEKYLDIGENMEVKEHPQHENIQFWESIYRKYGSLPYDTY